ncbi:EAL domain-containing protein [Geovibrio thiophilus]|uniref:EAL domain-containing protein n=1 Tax=Geovibrio thiophilus TaxID=139438 RepID=A0A3R5Y5Z4_9BACT|nr:EAL domain-containing protein [Geovibrio thiophilus]QAR32491.1 EAL domain-containing protein [Geovibrio thiophilus]
MINRKPKVSVPTLNMLNVLFISVSFICLISYFIFYEAEKEFEARAENIRERFIATQKANIKTEIRSAAAKIEIMRLMRQEAIKDFLKNRAENTEEILKNLYAVDAPASLITQTLDSIKWDSGTGYCFVFDRSGRFIFHGGNKALTGTKIQDAVEGNGGLEKFLTDLREKNETFGSYDWSKPFSDQNDLYPKIAFAKAVPELGLFVAAASYTEYQDAGLKKYILELLREERFGYNDYGYFFIMDENYRILMHPVMKELENRSTFDIADTSGKNLGGLFSSALKTESSAYVSYRWEAPKGKEPEEKITFIAKIPDWNWILATGFYSSDFNSYLDRERSELKGIFYNDIIRIAAVLGIIILITALISIYINIYIRKIERSRLREMNMLEQYKLVLDASSIVSKTDLQGRINYVNDKFCSTTLYAKEDVMGKSHNVERHPATPRETFRKMWETISSGKVWHGVLKNKKADGTSYYKSATIVPLKDENGSIIEYISSGHDITELMENRDKLENIFNTDVLTSLGSRMKLLADIEKTAVPVLGLLDIDRFSAINDHYGNKTGDAVIREVGSGIFRRLSRKPYSFYRVNADTFAVLADGTDIERFMNDIRDVQYSIASTGVKTDGEEIPVTLRSGIAQGSKDVLAYADMALNNAKVKNTDFFIYDPADSQMAASYGKDIAVLKSIYAAIRNDGVFPVFQPIYNIASGRIEKYECLMRAEDENGRILTPGDFMDISKKTRIYPRLTLIIIEKSVQKFKNLPHEFSINLTIEDLMNDETMEYLLTYAKSHDVLNRLVIEIVETEELQAFEEVLTLLKELKNQGVKIAIDDFGSGYSNFEYLIKLNADYVKIDAGIMRHVLEDERATEIVRSIVTFARQTGLKTIAEFISSEELLKAAASLGVDYAQGYHIGRPEKELID